MKRSLMSAAASLALAIVANPARADSEARTALKGETAVSEVAMLAAAGKTADAFVPAAMIANAYEAEASAVAQKRARSPQVKALADKLAADHARMGRDLGSALKASGLEIAVPAELDDRRQLLIQHLWAVGPGEFDRLYLNQQLCAERESLNLLNGYAVNGDNPTLKSAAAKAGATVQRHVAEVTSIGGPPNPDPTPRP